LEFFKSIKTHLKDGGLVAMNINATSENSPLLKSITNTMHLVFDDIYYITEGEDDWNFTVIASVQDLDFKKLNDLNNIPELEPVIKKALEYNKIIDYDSNYGHLTDDKAPIEHYTDWMVLDYIFEQMK